MQRIEKPNRRKNGAGKTVTSRERIYIMVCDSQNSLNKLKTTKKERCIDWETAERFVCYFIWWDFFSSMKYLQSTTDPTTTKKLPDKKAIIGFFIMHKHATGFCFSRLLCLFFLSSLCRTFKLLASLSFPYVISSAITFIQNIMKTKWIETRRKGNGMKTNMKENNVSFSSDLCKNSQQCEIQMCVCWMQRISTACGFEDRFWVGLIDEELHRKM